jgi:hypothetical protein
VLLTRTFVMSPSMANLDDREASSLSSCSLDTGIDCSMRRRWPEVQGIKEAARPHR